MANGQTTQQTCQACRGQGVLNNPGQRTMQVCPVCGGDGVKQQSPFRVPFWYVLPNAVLTGNQSGLVVTQTIDQDADFEWIWIISSQTGTWSVTIRDPSTGRDMSNNPINSENFAGTAQLPFPLIEPYVWARATSIKATFNDRSGNSNTVQLVLGGYKLYPRQAPMQGSQGAIIAA
jgi:hypothetical protein